LLTFHFVVVKFPSRSPLGVASTEYQGPNES